MLDLSFFVQQWYVIERKRNMNKKAAAVTVYVCSAQGKLLDVYRYVVSYAIINRFQISTPPSRSNLPTVVERTEYRKGDSSLSLSFLTHFLVCSFRKEMAQF